MCNDSRSHQTDDLHKGTEIEENKTNRNGKGRPSKSEQIQIERRQKARKEFNHPRDSVMAITYAMKALELDLGWSVFSA